jgi:hypothetical protein
MAKGSLYAVAGTLFFIAVFVYAIPRLGLAWSFGLALLVWVLSTTALYLVGNGLLK